MVYVRTFCASSNPLRNAAKFFDAGLLLDSINYFQPLAQSFCYNLRETFSRLFGNNSGKTVSFRVFDI